MRNHINEMTYERDAPSRVQSFNARLNHWQIKASSMKTQFPDKLVAVDLTDKFCDLAQCWLVRDGVGLFWDADHLSPAGASLVLPTLLNAIKSH